MGPSDSLHAIGVRHIRRSLSAWAWTLAVAAVVIGVLWYWLQPKNFDECMLAEMRGQIRHLYPNAEKVCTERFSVRSAEPPDIDFTRPTRSVGAAALPPGFVLDPAPVIDFTKPLPAPGTAQ